MAIQSDITADDQWFEGEDIDSESGINHLTKAIASLVVIRDGMMRGNAVDDRPPRVRINEIRDDLQDAVDGIVAKYPDAVEPYTEKGKDR